VGVGVVGEAGEVVAARDMDAAHADEVRGEKLSIEGVNAEAGEVLAEADEGDEVGAVGKVGRSGFLPAGEAVGGAGARNNRSSSLLCAREPRTCATPTSRRARSTAFPEREQGTATHLGATRQATRQIPRVRFRSDGEQG